MVDGFEGGWFMCFDQACLQKLLLEDLVAFGLRASFLAQVLDEEEVTYSSLNATPTLNPVES